MRWRRRTGTRVDAVPLPRRVTVCHPGLGVLEMRQRTGAVTGRSARDALAEVAPDALVAEATSRRRRAELFIGRRDLDVELFDERAEAEQLARARGWEP